jgi:hypothetical protein
MASSKYVGAGRFGFRREIDLAIYFAPIAGWGDSPQSAFVTGHGPRNSFSHGKKPKFAERMPPSGCPNFARRKKHHRRIRNTVMAPHEGALTAFNLT